MALIAGFRNLPLFQQSNRSVLFHLNDHAISNVAALP
jgi:hypothetical protein